MTQNVGDILRAAAHRVRQGWCQNNFEEGGNVCAVTAIGVDWRCSMSRDIERIRPVANALLRAIGAEPTSWGLADADRIWCWNDATWQTQENVATTLEYAALLWDQEQQIQKEQPQCAELPKETLARS